MHTIFQLYLWCLASKVIIRGFPIVTMMFGIKGYYKRFIDQLYLWCLINLLMFSSSFDQKVIISRQNCPHSSEQNSIIERKHRCMVEIGLILLAQWPSIQYCNEAFSTAFHLVNRLPTPVLQYKSPFETLNHTKPDCSFLKSVWVSLLPIFETI